MTMKLRSIQRAGRRSSLRLEMEFWEALDEIASRQCMTLGRLLDVIDREEIDPRGPRGFTARIRVFCVRYYRTRQHLTGPDGKPAEPALWALLRGAPPTGGDPGGAGPNGSPTIN